MASGTRGVFDREVLTEDQCRARLAEAAIARVVISVRCLPAALPVLIYLEPHHVLLTSVEDAVVDAARRGDVLAVQVDGFDEDGATWSVHVTGVAHLPEPTDTVAQIDEETPLALAVERGATLVAIPLTVIAGERIRWNFPG